MLLVHRSCWDRLSMKAWTTCPQTMLFLIPDRKRSACTLVQQCCSRFSKQNEPICSLAILFLSTNKNLASSCTGCDVLNSRWKICPLVHSYFVLDSRLKFGIPAIFQISVEKIIIIVSLCTGFLASESGWKRIMNDREYLHKKGKKRKEFSQKKKKKNTAKHHFVCPNVGVGSMLSSLRYFSFFV